VEFSDFISVFWEKVAEFGRTGMIEIIENFQDFCILWEYLFPKFYEIFGILRIFTEYIGTTNIFRNIEIEFSTKF
jgi:hypothetical protein